MQHGSVAKKAVKKRRAFIMRRSVNTLAHSRSLNSWPDFPWIEQKEMYRQNDPVPDDALTNGSPNSKVEERGDLFVSAYISYNARYVKYRGVKKASFLRFGFFGSLWTFRWPQCCFIGFLQFFIVWCISFAFCGCNSFFESFSITGFIGHTYIRFLRTVFFFRHTSFTFIMHYGIRVRTILIVLFFCVWPFVRAILIRWLDSGLWFHDNL